jgi:hypothetical protein
MRTYGCSVHKYDGEIRFKCGDKTLTPFVTPRADANQPAIAPELPPTLHVKDATGTENKNLIHISVTGSSAHTLFNRATNHTLSFDTSGNLVAVTKTFYTTANCSGQAYAAPSSGPSVKGRVLSDVNASPAALGGFIVAGFSPTSVPVLSQYQNGACTALSAGVTQLTLVEPAAPDANDPTSISLPLELVFGN